MPALAYLSFSALIVSKVYTIDVLGLSCIWEDLLNERVVEGVASYPHDFTNHQGKERQVSKGRRDHNRITNRVCQQGSSSIFQTLR